ncbi:hypothetical protein [Streptomyces sp. NPDC047725]|uniref:hypothetical protein n=1 Tax=Streptomyces sp. NPDC047725 TaxID=3365487 RepID=UPI00371CC10C
MEPIPADEAVFARLQEQTGPELARVLLIVLNCGTGRRGQRDDRVRHPCRSGRRILRRLRHGQLPARH